jgi:hypothetical protein
MAACGWGTGRRTPPRRATRSIGSTCVRCKPGCRARAGGRRWAVVLVAGHQDLTRRDRRRSGSATGPVPLLVPMGPIDAAVQYPPVRVIVSSHQPGLALAAASDPRLRVDRRPAGGAPVDLVGPGRLGDWLSVQWSWHFKGDGIGPMPGHEFRRLHEMASTADRRGQQLRVWGTLPACREHARTCGPRRFGRGLTEAPPMTSVHWQGFCGREGTAPPSDATLSRRGLCPIVDSSTRCLGLVRPPGRSDLNLFTSWVGRNSRRDR